ncbi:sensor histidine kinase [Paenibacillus sp. FSL W8-0426]|uniref:sensor histidine kinase n=1 Tax=Paenibacillus sp. FSL W8-0426 TaxID=2921714 RepID=UPI0030D94291
MFGKFKNKEDTNELFAFRLPILIWLGLVYAATIIMQSIKEPMIVSSLCFSLLFIIHVYLHLSSYRFLEKNFWLYFFLQSILIYFCAIIMPEGYQPVLIGLLPALIAQTLGYSFSVKRAVFVSIISVMIFFDSALTVGERQELFLFIPIFIMMLIIVIAYTVLFFRQVHERLRIRSFLMDLQEAHKKVEELTLSNERQRMARDLHDTLAQGLAGIIMRLEATNAHLAQGRTERAHEIVQQSLTQARRTLAEARRAIDDLRSTSTSDMNFKESIEDEMIHFKHATGIPIEATIRWSRPLTRLIMEHSLHIVKECLTNIARHAKANMVLLTVTDQHGALTIEIKDNGVGFNVDTIGKLSGHYGLLGIQERARLVGGTLTLSSSEDGTCITLEIPLDEGVHDE